MDIKRYDPKEYQLNKEKYMERQRRYRNNPKNKERLLRKAKERSRIYYSNPENRAKRYKYNREWWQKQIKKLEEIAGRPRPKKCEICKRGGKIEFDHDHKTGKFRGWICMKCNTILGKVNDDKKILQSLMDYLS